MGSKGSFKLTVLLLLSVPGRLLEGLDDEGSGRGHHGDGGLAVLDGQTYGDLEPLPIGGSLGDVIAHLLRTLQGKQGDDGHQAILETVQRDS